MTGLSPEEQASYAEALALAEAGRTVPLNLDARRGKAAQHWADLDTEFAADMLERSRTAWAAAVAEPDAVLVGAQRPSSALSGDAGLNLVNAVRTAASGMTRLET